jgi:hypothetical protein
MDLLRRHHAAAGQLEPPDRIMTQPDIREELRNAAVEPLLPIEKKLIGWSLGIGIVLLVGLAAFNHYFPATF